MSIVSLKNINKSYGKGSSYVEVLKNLNLEIESGDMASIMGPSGCGKSTLLNIIGCIDTTDSGEYKLNEVNIANKKLSSFSEIRNREVSFVFQNFALIKEFSVIENVMLPLNFRKVKSKEKRDLARKYLEELDVLELQNKKVKDLSGGQQQRVAIARALVQESNIILADEPTGALDEENSLKIMEILSRLNKTLNKTIIIVTHNKMVASFCNKNIVLKMGKCEVN